MANQDNEKGAVVFAVIALGLLVLGIILIVLFIVIDSETRKASLQVDRAAEEIPPHVLSAYKSAPSCSAIPWQVLAGIGKEESLHGTKYLNLRGDISFSRQVATDGTVGDIVSVGSAFTQSLIDNSDLDTPIKDGLYGITTGSDEMIVKEISVRGAVGEGAAEANNTQIKPASFEDVTAAIPTSDSLNPGLNNILGDTLPGPTGTITFNEEKLLSAQYLLDVGDVFNAPPRAKIIALSTALVEDELDHKPEGDRDSVGMLQQRPSQGWGTKEQIMDRRWAAFKFYDDLFFKMPERQKVASWTDLPPGVAAQEVQRSGFPDKYTERMNQAEELYTLLGGKGGLGSTAWTLRKAVMVPEKEIPAMDLPSGTFDTYGTDGNQDGIVDQYNYLDGIATLAEFLCAKAPNPDMINTDGLLRTSTDSTTEKSNANYDSTIAAIRTKFDKSGSITFSENLQVALHAKNPDASFTRGTVEKANYYTPQQNLGSVGDISGITKCSVGDDGMVPINTYIEAGPGIIQGVTTDVCPEIQANIQAMLDAAADDGIALSGWAHRPHSRQIALRKQNCANVWTTPSSSCRPPTARPGRSMHEQGLAMDFTYKGRTIKSRNSAAFVWLKNNAAEYGFKNLPSEPWHWSVNGN